MTLHSETGTLTPAPPFDFAWSLNFFGMFDPTRHEQSLEEGTLTKAVMIEGQTIIFRVKSAGTIQAPKLDYTLFSAKPITTHLKAAAADRLSFFLSLAGDLRPFYEIAKHDLPFAPIVERLYGYHQVKFLTPFENACWAVLTQRNPMAAARKTKDRLTEKFGGKLEVDGAEYAAFPRRPNGCRLPPMSSRPSSAMSKKFNTSAPSSPPSPGLTSNFCARGRMMKSRRG